jgi:hypothetical protein
MQNRKFDDLTSPDPRRRFRALTDLRHEYEPEVGEALVRRLVIENESGVWWLTATCTLPIWLPLFDRTLLTHPSWPFSGGRTLRVLELSQGHVLHSAERHVDSWLASGQWAYRFAAFRWLAGGGSTMERACAAAKLLLDELGGSFSVSEEALREYSGMEIFDDVNSREQELKQFLDGTCCAE